MTNALLDSLSPESRSRILALSKEMDLPIRTPIQGQGESAKFSYFLTEGIASFVINLPEGGSAEVSLMGREGFVDCFALIGPLLAPTDCFMQLKGRGYRILSSDLRRLFSECEDLRTRILQLVQQQAMTMSQIAACNKLHDAEPRLARWLLMVQDRVGGDVLSLTQEFLAEMLGTRRTTVALAAGSLQRSGFIEYKRGKVKILSREALETAACDCYPIIQKLFRNLYSK
jgi:CRP-like cAMP-binding protein